MRSHKRLTLSRKLSSLTLAATLCCAGILVQAASPAEGRGGDKVSPDLRATMARSGRVGVIVQLGGAASGPHNLVMADGIVVVHGDDNPHMR